MSAPEGPPELFVNGVDGGTGDYLLPPVSARVVAKLAQGERLEPEERQLLRARSGVSRGAMAGVDLRDLSSAGWGVVFPHDADPRIVEALRPLLDLRRDQAGERREGRFREYSGAEGYRRGESSASFLIRHGVSPAEPANPDKVPYYLLLVGDPETVPFRFQYQLDVVYGVGRLHFDTPDEYARYAEGVVRSESGRLPELRAAFFGTRNADDRATALSADHLIEPLSRWAREKLGETGWSVATFLGEGTDDDGRAGKEELARLLGGPDPASLVFSASHGMGFSAGHPRQLEHQGALLCQEWPGPLEWRGPIPPEFYFAAQDVGDEASCEGSIAFFFACYGAGTPRTDEFTREALEAPVAIAPHSFMGRLPQRLLGHPRGGALAVVGHVERAWTYSFLWPQIQDQLDTFRSAVGTLFDGAPLGAAIEFLNQRYAVLSTELDSAREELRWGAPPDVVGLSGLWTAKNDARNYVILGDPAVRLGHPAAP